MAPKPNQTSDWLKSKRSPQPAAGGLKSKGSPQTADGPNKKRSPTSARAKSPQSPNEARQAAAATRHVERARAILEDREKMFAETREANLRALSTSKHWRAQTARETLETATTSPVFTPSVPHLTPCNQSQTPQPPSSRTPQPPSSRLVARSASLRRSSEKRQGQPSRTATVQNGKYCHGSDDLISCELSGPTASPACSCESTAAVMSRQSVVEDAARWQEEMGSVDSPSSASVMKHRACASSDTDVGQATSSDRSADVSDEEDLTPNLTPWRPREVQVASSPTEPLPPAPIFVRMAFARALLAGAFVGAALGALTVVDVVTTWGQDAPPSPPQSLPPPALQLHPCPASPTAEAHSEVARAAALLPHLLPPAPTLSPPPLPAVRSPLVQPPDPLIASLPSASSKASIPRSVSHDFDLLTVVAASAACLSLVAAIICGAILRFYAHRLSEGRLASLLLALLLTLLLAMALPVMRCLILLPAIMNGAPAHEFTLLMVPIMAATSIVQFLMMASWISYRRQVAVDQHASRQTRGGHAAEIL